MSSVAGKSTLTDSLVAAAGIIAMDQVSSSGVMTQMFLWGQMEKQKCFCGPARSTFIHDLAFLCVKNRPATPG